jgi:hypothetical protein
MTTRAATTYEITFDHVGRKHDVPPLVVTAPTLDHLATKIEKYSRKFLLSRDVEIDIDDDGTGQIFVGFHGGGTFTWKEVPNV